MPSRLRHWAGGMVLLAICVLVVGWGLLRQHGQSAPRSAAVAQPWAFGWEGTPSSSDETLSQAFATQAYAISPSKARLRPAHVSWLAQSPSSGLALVRLDPANTRVALAYFTHAGGWTLEGAVDIGRTSTNPSVTSPIALPIDHYNGATFSQTFTPQFTLRMWVSMTHEFVFGYLPDQLPSALMPGQTIQVGPYQGWLSHQGTLSTIVIPTRQHTLVFSGNVEDSQAEVLAGQCIQNLRELTRIPASIRQ